MDTDSHADAQTIRHTHAGVETNAQQVCTLTRTRTHTHTHTHTHTRTHTHARLATKQHPQ